MHILGKPHACMQTCSAHGHEYPSTLKVECVAGGRVHAAGNNKGQSIEAHQEKEKRKSILLDIERHNMKSFFLRKGPAQVYVVCHN